MAVGVPGVILDAEDRRRSLPVEVAVVRPNALSPDHGASRT